MSRRGWMPTATLLLVVGFCGSCEAGLQRRSASSIIFPDPDVQQFSHLQEEFTPRLYGDPLSRHDDGDGRVSVHWGDAPAAAPPAVPPAPSSALQRRSSSSIIFPDSNLLTEQEPEFVPECANQTFAALDNRTGFCERLMTRAGCGEGEWFVLDRQSRQARCRPRPCPDKQGLHQGACVPMDDRSACAEHMALLVNEYGEAECDCVAGAVYWPAGRRCYPAMTRGPCLRHQILTVSDDDDVVCAENRCREGLVRWPQTGGCFPLRDAENAPCTGGRMDVDAASLRLRCVTLSVNTAFDTPGLHCSRGSRRFLGKRCKRQLVGGPGGLAPPLFTRDTRQCPAGFSLHRATGVCRRSFSGGGLG